MGYKIGIVSPNKGWGTMQLLHVGEEENETIHIWGEARAIASIGHQVNAIIIKGFIDIVDYDVEIVDVLKELSCEIVIINSPTALLNSSDKILATPILAHHQISVPPTLITSDRTRLNAFFQEKRRVVIKPGRAKGGTDQLLFDATTDSFEYLPSTLTNAEGVFYVQEYIPHTRDIRVFVIGERVVGAIYRYITDGQWQANLAKGAIPQKCILPNSIQEMAINATRVLGLDFSGVDILESKSGHFYVTEVNGCPGWKGFHHVYQNINIPVLLIQYLNQKLKGFENNDIYGRGNYQR